MLQIYGRCAPSAALAQHFLQFCLLTASYSWGHLPHLLFLPWTFCATKKLDILTLLHFHRLAGVDRVDREPLLEIFQVGREISSWFVVQCSSCYHSRKHPKYFKLRHNELNLSSLKQKSVKKCIIVTKRWNCNYAHRRTLRCKVNLKFLLYTLLAQYIQSRYFSNTNSYIHAQLFCYLPLLQWADHWQQQLQFSQVALLSVDSPLMQIPEWIYFG